MQGQFWGMFPRSRGEEESRGVGGRRRCIYREAINHFWTSEPPQRTRMDPLGALYRRHGDIVTDL